MSKTLKKRVKLGKDGWYYPQFRYCFIWCNYDSKHVWDRATTSVVFASPENAFNFLHLKDDEERQAIKNAKESKVIGYVRS